MKFGQSMNPNDPLVRVQKGEGYKSQKVLVNVMRVQGGQGKNFKGLLCWPFDSC